MLQNAGADNSVATKQYRGAPLPAYQVGKGNERITHPSQSAQRTGHPTCASAPNERVLLTGTRSAESTMASGYQNAASTGRTHGSSDQQCQNVQKILANMEPFTHVDVFHLGLISGSRDAVKKVWHALWKAAETLDPRFSRFS